MARSSHQPVGEVADDLFDKYTLPKAALAIILVASFVGTALTMELVGVVSIGILAAKWGYLVSLGILTGGLLWKHGFVRPRDLSTDADDYCAQMYARFDRVTVRVLGVFAVSGSAILFRYQQRLSDDLLPFVIAVAFGGVIVTTTVSIVRSGAIEDQFRSRSGVAALSLVLVTVVLTAVADVTLRGGTGLAVGVRVLHLAAFAVWLGGAVWNIFVAVPTGQNHTTIPVVEAAGKQLERFRWAVRIIIPVLLLTGLFQSVAVLGLHAGTYVESVVGLAVLGKLGLIAVLVGIFKLCPMWRACSPIDGVCDLDELQTEDESSMEGPSDA